MLRRRDAILGAAAACVPAGHSSSTPYPGQLIGARSALGHRLRDGRFPPPDTVETAQVVVVGAGIAGLTAVWRLQRAGVADVVLAELEPEVGGTARGGRNATSGYPWGAHYVPLLTNESADAAELFSALGIITDYDAAGRPVYDEYALCADPRGRLFIDGAWQEDLLPDNGVSDRDRRQYADFFRAMDAYRAARGSDGRKAFAIPLELSSADPRFRALDRISMARFMDGRGWDSVPLRWYVDYCCRDDYGTPFDQVSAWAGVHYHASRDGRAANTARAGAPTVLTWPDGNGYIVRRLQALLGPVRANSLAWRVTAAAEGVEVDTFDPHTGLSRRIRARAAILATPRFIADRLLEQPTDPSFGYAPWMVANVTLARLPTEQATPLCWDNAIYGGASLGYVVATHQGLAQSPRRTVLTWYWPLSDLAPPDARRVALRRSLAEWQTMVAAELLRIHPDLSDAIETIDVCVWGHGMIRPVPGFIWGDARRAACLHRPPVFFAHTDMSGIAIFEEAVYRGTRAAEAVGTHLRG